MSRDTQKTFKEKNEQIVREIQKIINTKIKTDKKSFASKVDENFQQNKSRLFWKSIKTIMGYKKKSGLKAADENILANDLNVFYTHFNQQDFCT